MAVEKGGGCQIHFAGLTKYSGTMYMFDFLITWARAMHLHMHLQCFKKVKYLNDMLFWSCKLGRGGQIIDF